MKSIQHKVYILEKEDGSDVNMNKLTSLNACVNDKVTDLVIEDLFKKFQGYEDNKLVGWSILELFKFEDGYLLDEDRNKISFYSKELDTHLYVKKVRNAIIMLGDIEVKDAYIRDVKKIISLSKGRVSENKQEQIEQLKEDIMQGSEDTPIDQVKQIDPSIEPELAAAEVTPEPAPEPTPEPEPVVEEPVAETTPEPTSEPEPVVEEPIDKDSYDYLKNYYLGIGYKEYENDNFRLLYKEDDIPYVIELNDKDFEQIPGDVISDNEEKLVYEFEKNGKSDKITFIKQAEQVSEQ